MKTEFNLSGSVVLPEGVAENTVVTVSEGKISAITKRSAFPGTIDLDLDSHYIGPGFIDIHVHGGNGGDFMSGNSDEIQRVLQFHLKHGTTGILPTTVTESHESIVAAVSAINNVLTDQNKALNNPLQSSFLGSQILGVHLEGPFINPRRMGGQNPAWIRKAAVEEYRVWEKLAPIRMLTLAPEIEGARELIEYAASQGVLISAGHTDAKLEEMDAAITWGVSHLTHFFNAMRELHHREPGVVGFGMMNREVTLEIIADHIHVHPYLLKSVPSIKDYRNVALITDAVSFCGLPDGEYDKRGRRCIVKDGSVRLEDGTLAGSTLTMNRAVKNMVELGCSIEEAWAMASEVPARLIRLGSRKGAIKVGMDADIVALNSKFDVVFTMVAGSVHK